MYQLRVIAPFGVTFPPGTRFVGLSASAVAHRAHALKVIKPGTHEAHQPVNFGLGEVIKVATEILGPVTSHLVDVATGQTVGQLKGAASEVASLRAAKGEKSATLL